MNPKKYVVISLFNGMGCAWIALEKAGIGVSQRISSEVDKYAIKSNDVLYPDTIQVGDVRKINVIKNKNGRPIKLETEKGIIDLLDGEIILAGGSPCQSFSFAGKMKGMATKDEQQILTLDHYLKLKEQEYEFEGQSYLFWEYMRIKNDLNPKYFLLENVIMVDKWKNVLSRAIGINPIRINAELVSAQNRDRYFWTDINSQPQGFFGDIECMIPQPKDKGILLRDILEKDVDEKYFLKHPKFGFNGMDVNDKSNTLRTGGKCSQTDKHNYDIVKIDVEGNPKKNQDKAGCLTAGGHSGGNHSDMDLLVVKDSQCVAMRGRNPDNPKGRQAGLPTEQMIEPRHDGKTNCLTSVTKDNLVIVKSQMQKVLDKTGIDISKVTEPTILDVYNKKLKEDGKCITLTDPCHNNLRLVVPANYPKDYPEYMKALEGELDKDGTANNSYWERINQYEKDNNIKPGSTKWPCPNPEADDVKGGDFRTDEGFRWRENGKTGTLAARAREDESCGQLANINSRIRRLTPRECGRLQTFPDDKLDVLLKAGISDSQLYKQFGNGWCVDVIAHIFSFIK